jgi:hypothetical protein
MFGRTQPQHAARGRRRLRRTSAIGVSVLALAAIYTLPASAVHKEGIFQLDRNATTVENPTKLGDDWDVVCKTATADLAPADQLCQSVAGTDHAVARSFDSDVFGAGDDVFTGAQPGGSSKDPEPISGWRYTQSSSTSAPDKDDIEHAYTAQYTKSTDPTTTTDDEALLYFGADRFAVSGDSQIGFWFFKSKVGKGPKVGNVGTFTGEHTARSTDPITHVVTHGDILILSDFLQGGAAPTVRVFEWVGSGGSDGSLDLIAGSTTQFADCLGGPNPNPKKPPVPPVLDNDPFCATVNTGNAAAPWPYTPKAGTTNTMPAGSFYEGGVNLTDLGLGSECFSTFLAETRSSQSPTATLKDFVGGGFGSCGASLSTQTSDTSFEVGDGTTPTDTATVSVTSSGSNPPAPTGDVNFYLCGPSASVITVCDPTGKTAFDTQDLADADVTGNDYSVTSDTSTINSAGYYCFASRWAGDTNYDAGPYGDDGTNECFHVTPVQPSISTQVNNDQPVDPGTELYDTATLAGTVAPSNSTFGTITFNAYGPADDATTCTAPALYTSVLTITGNGAYDSNDGDANNDGTPGEADDQFKPTGPGHYNWIASYAPATGDVNNLSISGACGDANEGSIVQQFNPALTTAQTWQVKDTATITVDGGGALAGTAHFVLYDNSSCTGTPLGSDDVGVAGASPQDATTSYIEFTSSAATLYWKVSYSSTNGAQTGIDATCVENSSLTIHNT